MAWLIGHSQLQRTIVKYPAGKGSIHQGSVEALASLTVMGFAQTTKRMRVDLGKGTRGSLLSYFRTSVNT